MEDASVLLGHSRTRHNTKSAAAVDGRRGFDAACQAIEVFDCVVGHVVTTVCGEEIGKQWRSLGETIID